jgi:ech hydrogenase subunit A
VGIVGFLVLFPLVTALALLCIKNNKARNVIVCGSAVAIGVGTLVLAVAYFGQSGYFEFSSVIVDYACSAIGVVIAICVLAYGIKYKNVLASVLGIIQVGFALVFEFGFAQNLHVENGLFLDSLTLLMALIIGIIGSGICVYALGYMEDFQDHHRGEKDRRPTFFALMFLFLSAMFGVVFSDNLLWLFTAWEVTTICSFLLIAYTKTEEAIKNAFRQVIMNMLGGISFALALFLIAINFGTLSFSEFLAFAMIDPNLATLPVVCLAFAGLTKAAQMPFHTWLLGAMVAPTPTSALLHSSTMVKAGVFLLVKLAPIFAISAIPSMMVILVGGVTFAFCSLVAISQSNAKRVLAYSTIANLGLIVACAGVGTAGAIWAAIFLIIFHAIAKSLLFLCVGTAEHHIGSRDIEDMDLLFERMPRLARYMMLGIMCMFIAPFGMLIAKWATLISFVDSNQIALILLLAFGSAATFMFWAKWFGKLSGIAGKPANVEGWTHKTEWASIALMAALVILCCAGLPLISAYIIEPYLVSVFGTTVMSDYAVSGIANTNLWITSLVMVFIVIVLFFGLGKGKAKKVDVYMSGVSVNNQERTFTNSLSQETKATARNWYMETLFGEKIITPVGAICCALIIGCAFIAALLLTGIM